MADTPKRFPIQAETGGRDEMKAVIRYPGFTIPWSVAEEAYKTYARLFPESASAQSLERMAERGGFGQRELLHLLSGGGNDKIL